MIRLVAIYPTSVSTARRREFPSCLLFHLLAPRCATRSLLQTHTHDGAPPKHPRQNAQMHPRSRTFTHRQPTPTWIEPATRTQLTNVRRTLDSRDANQLSVHRTFDVPGEIHTHVRNSAYPCRRNIHPFAHDRTSVIVSDWVYQLPTRTLDYSLTCISHRDSHGLVWWTLLAEICSWSKEIWSKTCSI